MTKHQIVFTVNVHSDFCSIYFDDKHYNMQLVVCQFSAYNLWATYYVYMCISAAYIAISKSYGLE